jgi:hypothetical protein
VPLSDQRTPGSASASADPFISLVLTGRNDGYGGDFVARFLRTLRFNLRQLRERAIPHEVVFVEWAPPSGARRLLDLAFESIGELEPSQCAWYIVDPEYQQRLSLNPRLEYLEFIAKNVGVRRARGRFVLTSNCDVFLGRHVLDVLQHSSLEPRTLYRALRLDLKKPTSYDDMTWEELEDPGHIDGPPRRLKPPLLTGGTGDFILLDRETFHQLRGFNEVYRAARIGIDRNFLLKAASSGVSIVDIGGPVFHVNHEGSYRLTVNEFAGREAEAPWGDRRWHSGGVIYINPDTWGLAAAPVRSLATHVSYLDFSWEAVPPLVDLRRVVLPVTRLGEPAPGRYVSRS